MQSDNKDTQKARLRIKELNNLTIDVSQGDEISQSFAELLTLITGAKYSQINIFDQDKQYTIASDGALFPPLPKPATFCTYTLDKESTLEIPDMTKDDRVKDHFGVKGKPHARYYFGEPLITKNEVAIGTVCIIHDGEMNLTDKHRAAVHKIAEQVTRHLELKNALVEKDKIIEEKHSTLKKVAHDLRSPIGAIMGSLSLVNEETLSKDVANVFDLIQKSCKSLMQYINELLDKNVKGLNEGAREFITPDELDEKLRSVYHLQAKEKNIRLDIGHDLEKEEYISTLSPGDLLNIAGNLISNAIKFTPEEGIVSVRTGYKSNNRNMYDLTVIDTGKGMTADQADTIRRQKQAVPDTGSNDEKGYGIGLYQALKTLKKNGGDFEIESAPGEGTRFSIFFPRKH